MEDGKFLTFDLAGQLYAIGIDCVSSILDGCGNISPVPEFPEYSRGVVNLRGDIIPIIDMRKRFLLPPLQSNERICVIVTECSILENSKYLGFVVDMVQSVVDFEGKDIVPAPKLTSDPGSKYIAGMYKAKDKIIMILEPELLLTDNMKEAFDDYLGAKTGE